MKKIVRLRRPIIMTVQGWFSTHEELVSAVEGDVKELRDGDLRVHAKRGWVIERDLAPDAQLGLRVQVGWGADEDDDEDDDGWNRQPSVRWELSLRRVNLKPTWIIIKERNIDALE